MDKVEVGGLKNFEGGKQIRICVGLHFPLLIELTASPS